MRTRKSTAAAASRPGDRRDPRALGAPGAPGASGAPGDRRARPDRRDRAAEPRPHRSPARATRATREPREASASVTRWTLSPEIEAEIAEIAAARGCELIHAEWKGGVLRLVLDRPPAPPIDTAPAPAATLPLVAAPADAAPVPEVAGVSLADCEQVARQASALLDVLDFGNGRYLLEVSSPGLDRQLYRPSDYRRFLGRLARITYHEASPGEPGAPRRRTVVGRLAELRPPSGVAGASGAGEVTLVDDRTGERLTLRLEDIRTAKLEVEL
jgi:ribosome maturation factor RimP